jgi:uncharacterized protein YdaU (DUF1376 family)
MKDPAFLFYPNDYIGGTMGMTFEEKGAYIELLMLQFNRGHMTSLMAGQIVGQLWVKIQDKFKIDENGLYYNERLDLEIEKRKSFVQSRFNNLLGKNQYTKKGGHKAAHMTNHMENRNRNEDINKDRSEKINVSFENFWNLYDKKRGDIKKLNAKWISLSDKDRQDIMDYIPKYKLAQPDKAFRKDPQTFLNNHSWNDEIIPASGTIIIPMKSRFEPQISTKYIKTQSHGN